MGIAQAMQARAAKIPPHTDMNPVLLKPKGESTSQIVLCGRPYKDVHITGYYQETPELLARPLQSYQRLVSRYGHVVSEGAGGAAEINLYDRDIANTGLARSLKVPVILVADIERGGVFGQLVGTISLLPEDIRPLVKGIIINKFRGDPSIFLPGIRQIEELTGVPVLGVLPHFSLPLPSEDSLSIGDKRTRPEGVRIAVIRLPRISNFTDFELLEQYASVEYVPPGQPLGEYDCIIIPGTQNTIEDLAAVQETGTGRMICEAYARGIPVIGICGGYQMLGKRLIDDDFESVAGVYRGLGLLDGVTRFVSYEKRTTQVTRNASPVEPILSGMGEVSGYEIHMGVTDPGKDREALCGDGRVTDDGLVFGTYMHGVFLNPSAANALLLYLYGKKGRNFEPIPMTGSDPYEELADLFEQHIDMDAIERLVSS